MLRRRREQVQAVGADGCVGVVDEDCFEEGVDRGAERCERGDGGAVVVGADFCGDVGVGTGLMAVASGLCSAVSFRSCGSTCAA